MPLGSATILRPIPLVMGTPTARTTGTGTGMRTTRTTTTQRRAPWWRATPSLMGSQWFRSQISKSMSHVPSIPAPCPLRPHWRLIGFSLPPYTVERAPLYPARATPMKLRKTAGPC